MDNVCRPHQEDWTLFSGHLISTFSASAFNRSKRKKKRQSRLSERITGGSWKYHRIYKRVITILLPRPIILWNKRLYHIFGRNPWRYGPAFEASLAAEAAKPQNKFWDLFITAKQDSHPFKIPRKITKTYQLSGTICKLQIQQKQIQKTLKEKQITAPERYFKLLSDEILQNISALKKHIKGINAFKREEEKLLALLLRQLSQKTALM